MLTDTELAQVRATTGLFHLTTWATLYRAVLGRDVTPDEVTDAHARLMRQYWHEHPAEKAEHDRRVAGFQAMQPDIKAFWRGDGWKP